ncbi:MAG: NADP-dependent isocitrate dehydrogenase [Candidatus Thermoplasmatota archaeon]|nr:NADP-dependent isocitrate dehydrogenase [Candidatus Thermoplasmatota archaeon]
MSDKIKVENTIVEIDGDEMTRIMWQMVKERLLFPYLDVTTEYYDLGLKKRDDTDDRVTVDAANAIKKHKVGVKCATITPNAARVKEYDLKKQWRSPNGTIRGMLDGTVFRAPILVNNIPPFVRKWKKPIHIGRHAYGDVYKNQEIRVEGPGKGEIVFTPEGGGEAIRKTIMDFSGPGILQGIHNTNQSISSFAKSCFTYAYDQKVDLWFSTKDTISKIYDVTFRDIFEEEFETNWKEKYVEAGLTYFFTLIDDAVARIMKSEGGMLWALKNYDGDVMSDMLASSYGSLAMMTSVLVSPHGYFEYEAAHGTVQKHYYKHLEGEKTSTNSMALIFAWTGCLKKRGELDGTPDVVSFAEMLEEAARESIEEGIMTGDLMLVAAPHPNNRKVLTEEFIDEVVKRLNVKMGID